MTVLIDTVDTGVDDKAQEQWDKLERAVSDLRTINTYDTSKMIEELQYEMQALEDESYLWENFNFELDSYLEGLDLIDDNTTDKFVLIGTEYKGEKKVNDYIMLGCLTDILQQGVDVKLVQADDTLEAHYRVGGWWDKYELYSYDVMVDAYDISNSSEYVLQEALAEYEGTHKPLDLSKLDVELEPFGDYWERLDSCRALEERLAA
jgi:hypothetical protein